ncbi:DNA-directed RNA polymerase I [Perkinsela sp. CCAP 1560/4]|nr:DNA-directed RNA polymerase I [Perkinsela sp. CCAP 1560/4]KNH07590.1 DNA-directed RNA polymerase I [Perkinsela sp. CCAP 1560/4]|eukprot:KNH05243.1 DNA-directed RNA polymerase I [Perkinsela sp. CCAP 1560/4]
MLIDRGYIIDESVTVSSLDDFLTKFCVQNPGGNDYKVNKKTMTIYCPDTAHRSAILVQFCEEPKISSSSLKDLVGLARAREAKSMIVVYADSISPIAKRGVSQLNNAGGYNIEMFFEGELMFNVTKHELVPRHVPLSSDEKKDMLGAFKLRDSQLPRISVSDPVSRYFGMQRGQVFKIIRPSETAGEYITYRLVV